MSILLLFNVSISINCYFSENKAYYPQNTQPVLLAIWFSCKQVCDILFWAGDNKKALSYSPVLDGPNKGCVIVADTDSLCDVSVPCEDVLPANERQKGKVV